VADHLFSFRVLSPLGTAFEGMAKSATLPTPDGEITILAHHMPLVAVLTDGEVRVDTGKKVVFIAVAGGFLETGKAAAHLPGTTQAVDAPAGGGGQAAGTWEATVLSDFAAESDSIEVARVEAARARAEQLLSEKKERGEILLVERDLQRSILQLKVAEKRRRRHPQA
jgi:F-type H+-transporting ATPase subunit epsilon